MNEMEDSEHMHKKRRISSSPFKISHPARYRPTNSTRSRDGARVKQSRPVSLSTSILSHRGFFCEGMSPKPVAKRLCFQHCFWRVSHWARYQSVNGGVPTTISTHSGR